MFQEYNQYTNDDHKVWKTLFERQTDFIPGKVTNIYTDSLQDMYPAMQPNKIPKFSELDEVLEKATGWNMHVVPGLIPVNEFFSLMNNKRFVSSTWLRRMDQLDYLEEPDMFHDVYGHVPLLMDKTFSDFIQRYTDLAMKHLDNRNILIGMERVYWFTIEFGLMHENDAKNMIYGAGIISSYGETKHVKEDDIEIRDYDIKKIFQTPFKTDDIQGFYYSVKDFQTLYESIEELEDYLQEIIEGKVEFVEGYTSLDVK